MMVYGVRNPDRTRVRLQDEPFDRPFVGWEERSGQVPRETFAKLSTSTDTVEIERLHQEIFLSLIAVP